MAYTFGVGIHFMAYTFEVGIHFMAYTFINALREHIPFPLVASAFDDCMNVILCVLCALRIIRTSTLVSVHRTVDSDDLQVAELSRRHLTDRRVPQVDRPMAGSRQPSKFASLRPVLRLSLVSESRPRRNSSPVYHVAMYQFTC
jgi:hypothetical protein